MAQHSQPAHARPNRTLLRPVANLALKVNAAVDAHGLVDLAVFSWAQHALVILNGASSGDRERARRRARLFGRQTQIARKLDPATDVILIPGRKRFPQHQRRFLGSQGGWNAETSSA